MPQLGKDVTALSVNAADNLLPAFYLFVGIESWRTEPPAARQRDIRRFRDDQTSLGRALGIILGHEFAGDRIRLNGSRPCKRRHDHAMAEKYSPQLKGREENALRSLRGYPTALVLALLD